MNREDYGSTIEGSKAALFIMKNSKGTEIKITNYGCIITSIRVKDNNGIFQDIVLGFDTLEGYLREHPYFGAVIGRYGNRIANSEFELNNKLYKLFANNGKNHLHGGKKGFDKVLWDYEIEEDILKLSYLSPDEEEGYPGNLKIRVDYSLTEKNELLISYEAVSDKDTIINLTNHSYFNLNGEGSGTILDHKLTLNADYFLPTDSESIPTGELRSVNNTSFDFRQSTKVGERIEANDEQLVFAQGYDHNYIINGMDTDLKTAAVLESTESGIKMNVYTTEPGIQLYTGNHLDGSLSGKSGKYDCRTGICLETQHFPDSPHFPNFPTVVLKKGDVYRSKTVYKFLLQDHLK